VIPKDGSEEIPIDGKYMTLLKRQPDGSWKIHRDIFNSNVPPAEQAEEVQAADDVEAVTAAVNKVWAQYESGMKSGDSDLLRSLWTDNGVKLPAGSPTIVGTEEIAARSKGFLDAFTVDSFDINNEEVNVAGDWAYARGTFSGDFTAKAGDETFHDDGKYITIFQRQPDGTWKIHRDIVNFDVE
jgi:uncharacterized protein (TIGR02246 family)